MTDPMEILKQQPVVVRVANFSADFIGTLAKDVQDVADTRPVSHERDVLEEAAQWLAEYEERLLQAAR